MKKRIIAAVLAAAIILSCMIPASAAFRSGSTEKTECQYPFLIVRGMDFGGLTYAKGTAEEQNCLGSLEAGEIIRVASKAIFTGLVRMSWDDAADVICDYCMDVMGLMACDKEGNSVYDVSVDDYPLALSNYPDFVENLGDVDEMGIIKEAVEEYGAENVYYYNYDWRLDPFMHAEKINSLVNQALSDSGKDKVNIICCSMGGIETVSYMYKYGYEKINRIIFLSSTITGTHVTSDILMGDVVLNEDILYNYCINNLSSNKALELLFKGLKFTGAFSAVCNLANNVIIPNMKDEIYEKLLIPVFGTIPSVWALVLPEQYDSDIEYMFGGKEDEYAGFIALTEEYQKMAEQRDDMLLKAESDGVSICLVAGYGISAVPVYEGGNCNGDAILEADRMLGEAKVGPLDGSLGYTGERVSPDGQVDLTDALFPETTWAIYKAKHVGCDYGTDMSEFIFTLMNTEGRVTVDTYEQYPQFMYSTDRTDLHLY